MKFLFFIFFLFSAVFLAGIVHADTFPQELYISSKGEARLSGAQYISKHALNFFDVRVWGQKWSIVTDYVTTFESSDGVAIAPEEMATGDFFEIKGRPVEGKVGFVEALLIRDLSITKGTGVASQSAAVISSIEPSVVSAPVVLVPPPAPVVVLPEPIRIAASSLTKDLRNGSRGGEVVLLQEFLQKNGWGIPNDGPVTGHFGGVTEKALKKFQEAQGLAPTGVVDFSTRDAINIPVVKKSDVSASEKIVAPVVKKQDSALAFTRFLGPRMKGSGVALLQEFLQKNNWGISNNDPVSGYFGSVTEKALIKFQQANGLEAAGTLGPKTRELINSLIKK